MLYTDEVLGDLIEQHPKIVETVLVTAVPFILPELPILRPILSFFGFSPTGPVKGEPGSLFHKYNVHLTFTQVLLLHGPSATSGEPR